MEIGNLLQKRQPTKDQESQPLKDLLNNACVVCHKRGCSPCKCSKAKFVNNVEAAPLSKQNDEDNGDDEQKATLTSSPTRIRKTSRCT